MGGLIPLAVSLPMHFIIKYFPEITIKSTPVRKKFTMQLRDNLRKVMRRRITQPFQLTRHWDFLEVIVEEGDDDSPLLREQMNTLLGQIPGIGSYTEVHRYDLGSLEEILVHTQRHYGPQLAGKTFVVRCKRQGDHEFNSLDVERYVGGGLLARTDAVGVRMKGADVTVKLEIRKKTLFVTGDIVPGMGGFPIGGVDSVLSLISGGFDSTVSTYECIKRGLRTQYCFFNLGGRAHELGVKEVSHYIWEKYSASHRVRFISIPFEEVVGEILEKVDNSQMGVVLKRMMLRAATAMAEQLNVNALVTGEAVAQVSSQTLINLRVIDQATDMLVLRPLITTDKGDIIAQAEAIGTAQFAKHMPEYCGVISQKPTTKAKLDEILAQEANMDMSILDRAIEKAILTNIDQLGEELALETDVSALQVTDEIGNSVVVDIRPDEEIERLPLVLPEGAERLEIPFYKLNSVFPTLDKLRHYLLYCDRGVMSKLHAHHLNGDGYRHVGVYRP